jgi:hypothetical protein
MRLAMAVPVENRIVQGWDADRRPEDEDKAREE